MQAENLMDVIIFWLDDNYGQKQTETDGNGCADRTEVRIRVCVMLKNRT